MSKNHTHKRKQKTQDDWAIEMDKHRLDWLKNGYGELKTTGPQHSYNAVVYVKDPTTAIGLAFYMHSLGFKYNNMWVQPWNISEMMHLENRFFTLIGNEVNAGGRFMNHGYSMTEQEIIDGIEEYIADVKESIAKRPDEMTYFDRDFIAKPIINCGSNYKMFKVVAEWNNDDFHSRLLVNSRDPEHPRLVWPVTNLNSIEDYCRMWPKIPVNEWYREATIDDVIEYFRGKGNWNHTDSYKETINGEVRTHLFEDEI